MGETGDTFRDLRKFKGDKRAANTQSSTAVLIERGIAFEAKNGGAHLVVLNRVDFWPSTGLFIDRQSGQRGRGVFAMIRKLRQFDRPEK